MAKHILTLPWPPAKSSPNGSQGDFRGKARAGKSYKLDCGLECLAQKLPRNLSSVDLVVITFHPPSNRKYDLDNHLAKMKRGLDAVSEHIGVDDSQWAGMYLRRGLKTPGGLIVCVITTTEGETT